MRKITVTILSLIVALCMTVSAFAVNNGGFVESPSVRPAPVLVSAVSDSADCHAEAVITAYVDRNTLGDEKKTEIEAAYNSIKTTTEISDLNYELAELAKNLNVDASELAVSELFDLSCKNCAPETHKDHGHFTIKIKADSLNNFVGLIHYKDNAWEVIPDSEVKDGVLTFKVKDFSPFAIVVDASGDSADTSDVMLYIWGTVAALSAFAVVVLLKKSKKPAESK